MSVSSASYAVGVLIQVFVQCFSCSHRLLRGTEKLTILLSTQIFLYLNHNWWVQLGLFSERRVPAQCGSTQAAGGAGGKVGSAVCRATFVCPVKQCKKNVH